MEKDVLSTEETITEYIQMKYPVGLEQALHQLESELKYLNVLANGASIDKNEDRRVVDFLQVHYSRLREYTARARHR